MRITGVDLNVDKEMFSGIEMIKVMAEINDPAKITQSRMSTVKYDGRAKWPRSPRTAPPAAP